MDDQDDAGVPSKPDHEEDEVHQKTHRNQNYDRDHEVGLHFHHSVAAARGGQYLDDDQGQSRVEAPIRVNELQEIFVVVHHHHLGLVQSDSYDDASEGEASRPDGAAI